MMAGDCFAAVIMLKSIGIRTAYLKTYTLGKFYKFVTLFGEIFEEIFCEYSRFDIKTVFRTGIAQFNSAVYDLTAFV